MVRVHIGGRTYSAFRSFKHRHLSRLKATSPPNVNYVYTTGYSQVGHSAVPIYYLRPTGVRMHAAHASHPPNKFPT